MSFPFHSLLFLVLSLALSQPLHVSVSRLSLCLSPSLQPAGEDLLPSRAKYISSPAPLASKGASGQHQPPPFPIAAQGLQLGGQRVHCVPPPLSGGAGGPSPSGFLLPDLAGGDENRLQSWEPSSTQNKQNFFLQLEGEAQS